MTNTSPCVTCGGKGVGIFKCEGCAQVFCRKHVNEHRDSLNQQLDEIIHGHDTLQQTLTKVKHERHPLTIQIDQWEQNSIVKIQQAAEDLRREIAQFTNSQKEMASKELYNLTGRLCKAREDDDFIESDLRLWTDKLEKIKRDLTVTHPSITIYEDPKAILVARMRLSTTTQRIVPNDIFLRSLGDVEIEDNGQVAIHGSRKRSDAYVCGQREYFRGQHKIRFIIDKKNPSYLTTFGIASMDSQSSVYGWSSNDQIVGGGFALVKVDNDQYDMKDETTLEIELLIDCDHRKISYSNQRTRRTRELNVDIENCPFPWQIYFYLFDVGDRVRLLAPYRST